MRKTWIGIALLVVVIAVGISTYAWIKPEGLSSETVDLRRATSSTLDSTGFVADLSAGPKIKFVYNSPDRYQTTTDLEGSLTGSINFSGHIYTVDPNSPDHYSQDVKVDPNPVRREIANLLRGPTFLEKATVSKTSDGVYYWEARDRSVKDGDPSVSGTATMRDGKLLNVTYQEGQSSGTQISCTFSLIGNAPQIREPTIKVATVGAQ